MREHSSEFNLFIALDKSPHLCIINEYSGAIMNVDQTILDLINAETIGDQAALRARLQALGLSITQPTLSRRLKRLNVRKVGGVYRRVERAAASVPDYQLTLAPPNLVVLRTRPGHAQVLAVLLDSVEIKGVAGTLSGDDAVFVAASDADLEAVAARVKAVLDQV